MRPSREERAKKVEDARASVTPLERFGVSLAARGIDERQAADLRGRLAVFAEEWESPEMAAYDLPPPARPM